MIESIVIKNVATYDANGIQIQNLKKINFLYGANGSGKTTISNFLHNGQDEKFNSCSRRWKDEQELAVLVYNKEFRERNFGQSKLNGVFTLGQATAEEIKIIENKTEELKVIKAEGSTKKSVWEIQVRTRAELEKEFTENCWRQVYKKYEFDFKEAFVGSMKSGELFKNRLIQEFSGNTSALKSIEELKGKAKTIFGVAPQNMLIISTIAFDRIPEIENRTIWAKVIVGKSNVDIAGLIQKLNINDWVSQGKGYLDDDSQICPFCQQATITADFKRQLESFFDNAYTEDIKLVKELKQEYNLLTQNIVNGLNTIEEHHKNFTLTKLDVDKFSSHLKTLTAMVAANNELLNNKIKEPSRCIELTQLKAQLDSIEELINNANLEIKKHNQIVANFQTEKANLVTSIWRFITEEFKAEIQKFNSKAKGLDTGIEALNKQVIEKRTEYKKLDDEIKSLSKNLTSIQPTIDEINRILRTYGFLNFEIVPSQESGFYQIQREDGTLAESTLSEGEITFLTFLYYLQLAKGGVSQENVNDERVLIIDDPISSLDSNVLFVVSTLIKKLIKDVKAETGNIKQIILLTHNVYFHKEVSFIDGRTWQCNKTNYWILRKNDKISYSQHYEMENPIQSSYSLLWQELRNETVTSIISVQNIMRRIIENYFKLLGEYRDDDLIQQFQTTEEQDICRSLISWINDGSHRIPDDLYMERQDRTIENYKKVFKDIFVLTKHEGHYNMMMGVDNTVAVA